MATNKGTQVRAQMIAQTEERLTRDSGRGSVGLLPCYNKRVEWKPVWAETPKCPKIKDDLSDRRTTSVRLHTCWQLYPASQRTRTLAAQYAGLAGSQQTPKRLKMLLWMLLGSITVALACDISSLPIPTLQREISSPTLDINLVQGVLLDLVWIMRILPAHVRLWL